MALAAGTLLGPYQIQSPLGGGGMGEVYLARDMRLDRDVAIKVLAGSLAHRTDVRDRFEREARAIASLNHPHICVVHDVGHQAGTDYLVMEYLEGETLAQRLNHGPQPLPEVLRLGAQIGDALDRAHRSGITHRDLKPANIFLVRRGGPSGPPDVKLLDFGLAKLRPRPVSPEEQPTASDPLTAQGTILGTLHYMAPEQLEGNEADARSDIFSLGAVLYEMATGKRAFEGTSQASLIAAIMASEPPAMSTTQPMTPPAFDRLGRKCLRKDPDERWQSARDVTDELRWTAESSSIVSASTVVATAVQSAKRAAPRRLVIAAVALLALLALVVAGFAAWPRIMGGAPAVSSAVPVRFTVGPPDKGRLPPRNTAFAFLSLSPDGTTLAFQAEGPTGVNQLWMRKLASAVAVPIPGTDGALGPFCSPDSRFIGFVADTRLKKVPAAGGPVQTIVELTGVAFGTWNRQGTIVFSSGTRGLMRVSDAGGMSSQVTQLDTDANEVSHTHPNFLPDGEHFLFLVRSALPGRGGVFVSSLGSRERARVLADVSPAVYVEPGYVLFHRDGTLMAQPFDATRLATTGEAVPIAEAVQFNTTLRNASFAASQNGTVAYRTASSSASRTFVWVGRKGRRSPFPWRQTAISRVVCRPTAPASPCKSRRGTTRYGFSISGGRR